MFFDEYDVLVWYIFLVVLMVFFKIMISLNVFDNI